MSLEITKKNYIYYVREENVILLLWGPNDLWARPIYPGESKGPSRGGLRPELDRITFGGSRGQFGPRQTQSSSAERRVEMVSD